MKRPTLLLCSLMLLTPPLLADDVVKTDEPETRFDMTKPTNPDQTPASAPQPAAQGGDTLNISPEELLKQPELLERALFSSVLFNNVEAVKVLLPIYLQLPEQYRRGADAELLLILSRAMVARADGRYGEAVRLYREALARKPEMSIVRLALAQSLFEDRQSEAARDQFVRLRSEPELPDNIRSLCDQYIEAIDKRGGWSVYGGMNYTRDNNINNTPSRRQVRHGNGVWTLPEPERAQGISYQAGASRDWNLKGRYSLRTAVDVYGKSYWDNHKYDDLNLRATVGGVYRTARTETAILPYVERRWYGTKPYGRETGLRLEWSRWLTPRTQFQTAAEWGKERYDWRKYLEGYHVNASATWLFVQNARQYWMAGVDVSRKTAQDDSDAYFRRGLRVGWTREWGKGFSTSLTGSVGERRYDGVDITNVIRKDMEYSGSLALWNRRIHLWGITPKLVAVWQKTRSNHPFYGHQKANAYLQFNKTF